MTLIGTSEAHFERAIEDALDSVCWVEIVEQGIEIQTAGAREYQAEVEVAFELD